MVEVYSTPDTTTAAYLVFSGHPLFSITYEILPSGKRQGTFHFNETPTLTQSLAFFTSGQATVNLVLYEHTRNTLLDRVLGRDR